MLTSITPHEFHLLEHLQIRRDHSPILFSADPYIARAGKRARDANEEKTDGGLGTGVRVRDRVMSDRLIPLVHARAGKKIKHNACLLLTLVPHIR